MRTIDHEGTFEDRLRGHSSGASLTDDWVLFVRRREADYIEYLEELRELYAGGTPPPLPFLSLVVADPSRFGDASDLATAPATGIFEDATLFLPKAANEEQFRILKLAQARTGVTAQGPPGTGKSHTIANLVSHFVAEGKRVLVTSEKEQALAVLSEKLPPAVRDLSVLDEVDSDGIAEVARALLAAAKAGDTAAARLVLSYALGPPLAAADPDRLDSNELEA
ncbi:MAG: AAA domain-containing protein, partial [Chloroflexota bacterium]